MGNKANKQKPGPEPDPSESQGRDLPSKVNSSRPPGTDPRKETLPPPLPLNAEASSPDTEPPSLDARNEPPPDESSDPDPPSLDAESKSNLSGSTSSPPSWSGRKVSRQDPPSLDAESKSNLSGSTSSPPSWSGRKVSRQERRRKERMKRKFKGNCILMPLTEGLGEGSYDVINLSTVRPYQLIMFCYPQTQPPFSFF